MNPVSATLPIAIIGAGPVGLAAAAHLHERSLPFVVLDAGPRAGHAVRSWGHVQLFSPWQYCVDEAAARLLALSGWQAPEPDSYPTGQALVERYLEPLAALPEMAPHLRFDTRVTAVARAGFDKMKSAGREQAPFAVYVEHGGQSSIMLARGVIDASGTWFSPNPLGAGGMPAVGERELAGAIWYGIPDVRGAQRWRYAGKRVLVAGSGHSAFNTLLELAALADEAPGTSITWVVRRPAGESASGRLYGGGADDALPARGALGMRIHALVERGVLELVHGWHADKLEQTPHGIVVSAGQRRLAPVDEVIVATGLRPDLAMLGELRLGLDPIVEAPAALAPLIDPNVHSCGSVPPHGAVELGHPERDFYMIGMKSYGRAPTFLLLTGYEQARSVAAALAGDWEAARQVKLVLPETGVCSGPVAAGSESASCCGPAIAAPRSATNLIELLPGAANLDVQPVVLAPVVESACCSPTAQATCCEPEAKSECCGATAGATCGCQ